MSLRQAESAAAFARFVASSFKKSVGDAGAPMGLALRPWEERAIAPAYSYIEYYRLHP